MVNISYLKFAKCTWYVLFVGIVNPFVAIRFYRRIIVYFSNVFGG